MLSHTLLWCIIVISAAVAINHSELFPNRWVGHHSSLHPAFLLILAVLLLSCPFSVFEAGHFSTPHHLFSLIFSLFISPSCITYELKPSLKLRRKRRVKLTLMAFDATWRGFEWIYCGAKKLSELQKGHMGSFKPEKLQGSFNHAETREQRGLVLKQLIHPTSCSCSLFLPRQTLTFIMPTCRLNLCLNFVIWSVLFLFFLSQNSYMNSSSSTVLSLLISNRFAT